jgi:hypothetical protein
MKAAAKGAIMAEPLDLPGSPKDRAKRREHFIHDYVVIPKSVGVSNPVSLRDFQTEIVRGAFAPGIRTALVSVPASQRQDGATRDAGRCRAMDRRPVARGPRRRL